MKTKMYRVICPPLGGRNGWTVWISEEVIKNRCPHCGWKNKKCRPLPEAQERELPDFINQESQVKNR